MQYPLRSTDRLTVLTKKHGISSWAALTDYVRRLPYGRNYNRRDCGRVLSEQRGTCSSKHALLQRIADANAVPNVSLVLAIYRMNAANTPGIGDALQSRGIDFMPEAHCYLKIDGVRHDFTSPESTFERIADAMLEEQVIEPDQVVDFKPAYHREYIRRWLSATGSAFTFEEFWEIRERCIANLGAE